MNPGPRTVRHCVYVYDCRRDWRRAGRDEGRLGGMGSTRESFIILMALRQVSERSGRTGNGLTEC